MADATGVVHSTAPGIARRANLGLVDTEKALLVFEAPDKHSRSLEEAGRRIKRVDGGYQIVNYEKYRERDYTAAERQKRWRERRKIPILSLLVEWDGLRCGICGDAIAEISEATIDHITPLSRGGLDVPENRQLAHSECNQRKSNSADPSAWRHPSMPNRNGVTRVTKRVTSRKQKQSTEAEAESKGKNPLTIPSLLLRVFGLFGKRTTTPLDDSEQRAWKKARVIVEQATSEEWELLGWAYSQTKGDAFLYRRKSMATLLNNWNSEIEKAQGWRNGYSPKTDRLDQEMRRMYEKLEGK